MTLVPLAVACPVCGSTSDVVYSCKPECCFNHVCANCYTTFELSTHRVGEATEDLSPLPPDPDPASPTAPCARCGESKLFALVSNGTPSGQMVCTSCGALLVLEISEVARG